MKKSGVLHTPLSNLDLFELVTLKGDGLRAEPWNRTTPYELEARHALFTLVPLIKTRRRFSYRRVEFTLSPRRKRW